MGGSSTQSHPENEVTNCGEENGKYAGTISVRKIRGDGGEGGGKDGENVEGEGR